MDDKQADDLNLIDLPNISITERSQSATVNYENLINSNETNQDNQSLDSTAEINDLIEDIEDQSLVSTAEIDDLIQDIEDQIMNDENLINSNEESQDNQSLVTDEIAGVII